MAHPRYKRQGTLKENSYSYILNIRPESGDLIKAMASQKRMTIKDYLLSLVAEDYKKQNNLPDTAVIVLG